MTEEEWLACTDLSGLLRHLGRKDRSRKLRLFACACCRRAWGRTPHKTCRRAVEVAERYADGQAGDREREQVFHAARDLCGPRVNTFYGLGYRVVRRPRYTFVDAQIAAEDANLLTRGASHPLDDPAAGAAEYAAQCRLLRDIIGNPFRPVTVSPSWQTPQAVALAQAAYEQREMPAGTLDLARLAILADALEEAGCTD